MNVYVREMKSQAKSFILWSVGMVLFVAASIGKYAGMGTNGQTMNDLMAEMPSSLQAIMGTGTFDLSKISGYYGVLVIYLFLLGTIHAAMLGANLVAKEERDKTAEFLFVKPMSRNQVIGAKLLAALTNIIMFNLVTMVSCLSFVSMYGNGESVSKDIFLTMMGMLILQLLFMAIGTAIASLSKRPKLAAPISTGLLLITFMLSIVIDLNEKLKWLKFVTPFKYFEAKKVMYGGGLDGMFVGVSFALIIGLILLTFIGFKKRDLFV